MFRIRRLADLKKRLPVSIAAMAFVGLLIAFSPVNWVGALLALSVALIGVVGVWEYIQLALAKELKLAKRLMIGVVFCEIIAFAAAHKTHSPSLLPGAILVLGVVAFFLFHFKEVHNALVHIAVEFFGVCYIAFPLSFMFGVLYPVSSHAVLQDGRWWLAYLIIVTKITDVAAYFVGRLWGKHKLAPVLSPKKTVEGAIAGFICATLTSLLLYLLGRLFSQGAFDLTLFEAIWLGMLIGIAGQVGDLAESLLKRDAVVKDSNALPGIGGVLDMLDSLLFTAPIVYFFLRMH